MIVRTMLFLLCLTSTAVAAPPLPTILSPETDDWYRWRIVLRVKPHPQLDKTIRAQLVKDLSAAVAPSVSKFAEVEVYDLAVMPAERKDPLIKAFEEKGWPALAQQEFHELTGIKTHFLTLEFKNGQYRLESRQHDGSTGLISPVLRTNETRAIDQIARLAGQMLFPDFGPVCTIIGGKETESTGFVLSMRGAARAPIESLIKAGDIFAVSLVTKNEPITDRPRSRGKTTGPATPPKPPSFVGTPKDYTFLKAITAPNPDGTFRCSVITRYEVGVPTTLTGLVGARAMKLSGLMVPVKVKVVTKDGKPHPRASLLTVYGTDGDYAVNPGPRDGFAYNPADGTFQSARPLQSIACLVVGLSQSYSERFPIALSGQRDFTIVMENDEATARKAELEKATVALRMSIAEAHTALTSLYETTGRLANEQRNKDALDRVQQGVKTAETTDQTLTAELERIRKIPGANIADCEQHLKMYREWRDKLKSYEVNLAAAAKVDPIRMEKELRVKDLAERIKTLREQGEIPEALETYDELIELSKDDKMKVEKEKLAREWAPQDEAHRAAREVLLVKWPSIQSVDDFVKNTTPFVKAAELMMKKGDRLGTRKLYNAFNLAYSKLKALTEALDASNADDQKKLEQINNVYSELKPLEEKVRSWLDQNVKK